MSHEPQVYTLFFSDIERSTELLVRLADRYADLLDDHDRIISAVVAKHHGEEIDRQGDSVFAVFRDAADGLAAAVETQAALGRHRWPDGAILRVRIGLHQGPISNAVSGLVGLAIHVAARVCEAAHGGQILVTDAIVASVSASTGGFEDFGWFRLRYVPEPCRLFAVRTGFNPLAAPRGVSPWRDGEQRFRVEACDPLAADRSS